MVTKPDYNNNILDENRLIGDVYYLFFNGRSNPILNKKNEYANFKIRHI